MVDERYDPAFQRGYQEPVVEAPDAIPRRNPWLVILWALAVVLIAVGSFLLTQTSAVAGAEVVSVLVLPVVFAALAPWVLGVGLGALVAAVFAQSIRWRQ